MHNESTRRAGRRHLPRPHSSAVTWIDRKRAIVARTMPSGAIDVSEVELPLDPTEAHALTRIADIIGDRERILISGSAGMRTALERQHVAIYRRPDRLVDVEPTEPMSRSDVVARLREIAQ